MQQCAEGWHRTDEPETLAHGHRDHRDDEDQDEDASPDETPRISRSTRHRDDVADLPRKPAEDRTVGRVFTAPSGKEYRPSMFLTLTMPSYGAVRDGVPVDPATYDYRRAALDALHFAKLAAGSGRTFAAAPATAFNTSRLWSLSTGWRLTCTLRFVGRSRDRRCAT